MKDTEPPKTPASGSAAAIGADGGGGKPKAHGNLLGCALQYARSLIDPTAPMEERRERVVEAREDLLRAAREYAQECPARRRAREARDPPQRQGYAMNAQPKTDQPPVMPDGQSLASSACSAPIDSEAELLERIRADKKPTKRGVMLCGYAMARCLQLGWSKDALDALEIMWWSIHDGNGEIIRQNAEVCHGRETE